MYSKFFQMTSTLHPYLPHLKFLFMNMQIYFISEF